MFILIIAIPIYIRINYSKAILLLHEYKELWL